MSANTSRYGFTYPSQTDSTNVPGNMETFLDQIDADIVMEYSGTYSDMPAAAIFGRRYYVTSGTNTGLEYFDTGTAWINVGPINTASGNIHSSRPGDSAGAGSTGLTADAGHTHSREAWGQASDYLPSAQNGAAGSTGRVADAGHVHPGSCIGDIKATVSGLTSTGWVVANGSAVSRTGTYAAFYAACGGASSYPWGQGDGSTTFNLPDLRNRVLVGAGSTYSIGQTGGNSSTTISATQLPQHTHTVNDSGHAHGITDPGHGHLLYSAGSTSDQLLFTIPSAGTTLNWSPSGEQGEDWLNFSSNAGNSIQPNSTGITGTQSHVTGITLSNAGSSASFSLMQPYAGVQFLVKIA